MGYSYKQLFQHTAARRRLGRPHKRKSDEHRFNTQPPEGGWPLISSSDICSTRFQHTAARRRLAQYTITDYGDRLVSTHSRPKAAGTAHRWQEGKIPVSTHSRPKAAGSYPARNSGKRIFVSTHSRPKAAGNPHGA